MIEIWRKRLIILNRVVRDGLAQDGTFKMRLKEQEKGRLAKVEKRGFWPKRTVKSAEVLSTHQTSDINTYASTRCVCI